MWQEESAEIFEIKRFIGTFRKMHVLGGNDLISYISTQYFVMDAFL